MIEFKYMMGSESYRPIESFAPEKHVLVDLDRCIKNETPWRPGDDELLGSIQRFYDTGEATGGTALSSEGCIVVEQGSFVRIKGDVTILSPDFTRCIALLSRDHRGTFFAHSTEHDSSLIELLKKYGSIEGSSAFVPEDPPAELDIESEDREKLKNIREKLLQYGVKVVSYPWSDFPPTHTSAYEGYVVCVSQLTTVAMKTCLIKDDSPLGYHHERLINEPVIHF